MLRFFFFGIPQNPPDRGNKGGVRRMARAAVKLVREVPPSELRVRPKRVMSSSRGAWMSQEVSKRLVSGL